VLVLLQKVTIDIPKSYITPGNKANAYYDIDTFNLN
jgi:hypothetical protein